MSPTRAASATKERDETAGAPRPPKYHACNCLHGTKQKCAEETTKAFARGHDARMSSRIAQLVAVSKLTEAEGMSLLREAGGSDLLVSKTKRSIQLRNEKRAAKDAPKGEDNGKPARSARRGKAASEEAPSTPGQAVGKIMIITHPDTGKEYKSVVVRTAGGDLKARHRVKGQNCDHDVAV